MVEIDHHVHGLFRRKVHCEPTRAWKIRHLETKFLWLQQAVFTKRIDVRKIKGTQNQADVLTKYLSVSEMQRVVEKIGIYIRSTPTS